MKKEWYFPEKSPHSKAIFYYYLKVQKFFLSKQPLGVSFSVHSVSPSTTFALDEGQVNILLPIDSH